MTCRATVLGISLLSPLGVLGGCFNPDDAGVGDTDATAADSSGGTLDAGSGTGPDPSGTDDGTSPETSADAADETSTDPTTAGSEDDETGVPIACGDGTPAPGEVCLGETLAVMGGGSAESMHLGDFDNDDVLDVVVTSNTQGIVFLGDGAGGFAVQSAFPIIESTIGGGQAIVAYLNDDGFLDIAATGGGTIVASALGNGQGGFAAPVSSSFPSVNADTMLAGDFTDDGTEDLLVSRISGSELHLAEGLGNGTFAFPLLLAVPNGQRVAGDFDDDGRLDALLGHPQGGMTWVRGIAGGSLEAVGLATERTFGYGQAASAGDVDDDGTTDAVFVMSDEEEIALVLGTAGGGPTPPTFLDAGARPTDTAMHDMDGDGALDIVVCGTGVFAGMHVLLGDGQGNFLERLDFDTTSCTHLAVGDVDDDGAPDVVFHTGGGDGLRVMLATP